MNAELIFLLWTAGTLGVVHTLLGPDHYAPFVVMSRAQGWTRARVIGVTLACGLGHILSSVVLGAAGAALGLAFAGAPHVDASREAMAGWFLIAFGPIYFAWGLQQSIRHREHSHVHGHADGTVHVHIHRHDREHSHVHLADAASQASLPARLTAWILFTIFVTGPCKPLIPLLTVPAARHSFWGVLLVTVVSAVATLATMSFAVLACRAGLEHLPMERFQRFTHALAGAAIALCGFAIRFLNL
ncbi:MAG: hypothetical protein M1453_08705 [Acidobacteria bacterium]|nr:hypothetical protein [Acidobacteriota bacterium]MCL5288054.1 hypothetical protein [Acidobacteriota bacterium]